MVLQHVKGSYLTISQRVTQYCAVEDFNMRDLVHFISALELLEHLEVVFLRY